MSTWDLSPFANHLWQSTLCASAAWLLTLALRKNRAAVRYRIWLAASLKFLIPFSLLFHVGAEFARTSAPTPAPAPPLPQISFVQEIGHPFAPPPPVSRVAITAPVATPLAPMLLGLWLSGFAGSVLIQLRHWNRMRRALHRASPVSLGTPIPAFSCPTRLEPGLFGVLRPVLVLPEGIADRLSPRQLDAIVTHELCHLERRDNLTALVHMAAQALFWFHPLVRWIGSRLVEERERACDEAVLGMRVDPEIYAEGILNVCKFCLQSPLTCVSGITGADLKKRIESIMSNRLAARLNLSRALLLSLAALAIIAGPIVLGTQAQDTHPEFDVASVKPFKPGSAPENRHVTAAHGSLTLGQQSLRECIAWAYDLNNAAEIEGPAWMDDEHYDISAKAAESADQDQLRLMLQTLLAQRFHLTLHRKTVERPTYFLTVAKNGPKLHEVQTGPVRGAHIGMDNGNFSIRVVNRPSELVRFIGMFLDHPVLDRTELTGVYEMNLRVEMNEAQAQLPQPGQMFHGFGLTQGVFPALEQLGLKLTLQKAPADILFVDRVERPSPN